MIKKKIATAILVCFLHIPSALASGDCMDSLRTSIAAPAEIVKGMADYKAAMDAGYAACMVSYPKEFAPLLHVNNFMQTNMSHELEQARQTLFYFMENPPAQKTEKLCRNDGDSKESLKKETGALIDGQYKKSYARRHRIMSKAGLVTKDQDSCLIVLDMVKKYDTHYGDFKQLRHILYESSKKQLEKPRNAPSRADFAAFEKMRNHLAELPGTVTFEEKAIIPGYGYSSHR